MLRRPPSHQYQNEITFITAIITLHNIALHYTFTIAILHVIIKYGSCTTDLPRVCSQKSISQSVPEHVLSIFSLAKHGHLVDGSELGGWLKRLLWPGMVLALTCCTSSTPGVSKSLYWGKYYIHTCKKTLSSFLIKKSLIWPTLTSLSCWGQSARLGEEKSSCHDIGLTMDIDNFWPFLLQWVQSWTQRMSNWELPTIPSKLCILSQFVQLNDWAAPQFTIFLQMRQCSLWQFCNISQSGLYDTIQTNVPFQECKTQNTMSIKVVSIWNWIVHSNSVFDKLDLFLQS